MDGGTELAERIAEQRAGVGDPRTLIDAVREALLLVPVAEEGLWTAHWGGVRWVCAFTDEVALARFAERQGAGDRMWEYASLLGSRILDEIIPAIDEPAGLAVDVATEDGSMFFPPVTGVVPETSAVDTGRAGS